MEEIKDIILKAKTIYDETSQVGNKEYEKRITNQDSLREEVMSFVASQMHNISKQNLLEELVTQELMSKIALHEIGTDELMQLLNLLGKNKTDHTKALLEMFKPTQNTNTMMTPPEKGEEVKLIDLNSEQRQSLEKLTRVMEVANVMAELVETDKGE